MMSAFYHREFTLTSICIFATTLNVSNNTGQGVCGIYIFRGLLDATHYSPFFHSFIHSLNYLKNVRANSGELVISILS